jgi:hypothetical protein
MMADFSGAMETIGDFRPKFGVLPADPTDPLEA